VLWSRDIDAGESSRCLRVNWNLGIGFKRMDEESFRMQVGIFEKVALSEFEIWRFGRRVGNAKKDRMREEHPLGNPSGPPCRARLDLVLCWYKLDDHAWHGREGTLFAFVYI